MSEPIRDVETAVRELGALPMPVGTEADQLRAQIVALQEAVARAEREAERALRERDIIRERVSEPFGCRYCGEQQRHHGRQYLGSVGMHSWEKPTDEQVKDRMLARRAARMPLELEQLRGEVAALRAERHTTNEALSEAAEALRENRNRIAELERPAVERHRREVRESYRWLAAYAREDGDFEGEAVVMQQLAEREQLWSQEDRLAREFAADPLAAKPWTPGPSVEASADKLTRLLAPASEGEHYAVVHHDYRKSRDFPETGGAR